MKKYFYSFLFIALFGLLIFKVFFKNSLKKADDSIIIGTNSTFPPYEFIQDGKLVGFDIDLMEEIGKRINKKIIWKDIDFDALILDAESGRIDGIIAGMTPTLERAKKILFTNKYIEKDPFAIVTKDKNFVHSINDLFYKTVIVVDGYTEADYISKYKDIDLIKLNSSAESVLALINDKGFAHFSALSVIKFFLKKHKDYKFNICIIDVFDYRAIGISKKNNKMLNIINLALTEIEKDGTLKKIKEKWDLV